MDRIAGSESTPEELYAQYFSSAEDTSYSLTEVSDSSDAGYTEHHFHSDHYSDHYYYSDSHYAPDSYDYYYDDSVDSYNLISTHGSHYGYSDGYSDDYYPYSEDSYYHYSEDSYYPYSDDSYYYSDDYHYSDEDHYYSDDSYHYDNDSYYYHNNGYDDHYYSDESVDSYYQVSSDSYQGYYRFPGDPASTDYHTVHSESDHYVEDHYVEEPAPLFKHYDEFLEAQNQPQATQTVEHSAREYHPEPLYPVE